MSARPIALGATAIFCMAIGCVRAGDGAAVSPSDAVMPFDAASIKRGRQLYAMHCLTCHGTEGRGDTEMREFLKTAPADLTDDVWSYGGDNGAVFHIISVGNRERDMPGFADKLTEQRIWQIVAYIRYLGGRRP